jgi:hypothetical protein
MINEYAGLLVIVRRFPRLNIMSDVFNLRLVEIS